jgi:hypothetical protein
VAWETFVTAEGMGLTIEGAQSVGETVPLMGVVIAVPTDSLSGRCRAGREAKCACSRFRDTSDWHPEYRDAELEKFQK